MTERKNFSIAVIEEVYQEQGGMCGKCGKSLMYGYHAHHKDSNSSNNHKENCHLLCKACHGGEQYITLQDQKKSIILDLDALVKTGLEGKASGATIDKLLDAIKLKLSLQGQIYDDASLEPPIEQRMKDYQTVMQHGLQEYTQGVKDTILKLLDWDFIFDSEHKQWIDASCDNPKLKEILSKSKKVK